MKKWLIGFLGILVMSGCAVGVDPESESALKRVENYMERELDSDEMVVGAYRWKEGVLYYYVADRENNRYYQVELVDGKRYEYEEVDGNLFGANLYWFSIEGSGANG